LFNVIKYVDNFHFVKSNYHTIQLRRITSFYLVLQLISLNQFKHSLFFIYNITHHYKNTLFCVDQTYKGFTLLIQSNIYALYSIIEKSINLYNSEHYMHAFIVQIDLLGVSIFRPLFLV